MVIFFKLKTLWHIYGSEIATFCSADKNLKTIFRHIWTLEIVVLDTNGILRAQKISSRFTHILCCGILSIFWHYKFDFRVI
jgi:hypothetical protein